VSVLPYWFKAVRTTLKGVPAVGAEVDGLSAKVLSLAPTGSAARLIALAELQES
jgi:hypothetical protein